jgi:hypothetical protein
MTSRSQESAQPALHRQRTESSLGGDMTEFVTRE